MKRVVFMLARFATLAVAFMAVAALSNWPPYRTLPEDTGVLTLSFGHGADRGASCRPATEEELKALPPNMRRRQICPRERPAIRVELDIDGVPAFAAEVPPSGIGRDGPSRVHERFVLPVGDYRVALRLRDRPGEDFDWHADETIHIGPADHRVIDFRAGAGGFVFQ